MVHDQIVKGTRRDVPPNIPDPDVTKEHEANGPQRIIQQGSQCVSLNSIFHCYDHRQNTGLCEALVLPKKAPSVCLHCSCYSPGSVPALTVATG